MIELIAGIVFLGSIFGMGFILVKKMPVLVSLPEVSEGIVRENFILRLKGRIKNLPFIKSFSLELFLQKTLSKIRVLILKLENKIANLLQKLRKKSQENKTKENDNYWTKVKSSIDEDKKS